MPQSPFDVFLAECTLFENLRVLFEFNERAIRFLCLALVFLLQLALLERSFGEFTLPMAAHKKEFGKRIHRLGAHAVQTHAELEHIVVVFGARVDLGNAIHHFAQRNASSEIPHRHAIALDMNLHLPAVPHDEFIHRVIEDFLHQDITTVIGIRAIADAPDIHARPQPDMLQGRQRLDFALVVIVFRVFSHKNCFN